MSPIVLFERTHENLKITFLFNDTTCSLTHIHAQERTKATTTKKHFLLFESDQMKFRESPNTEALFSSKGNLPLCDSLPLYTLKGRQENKKASSSTHTYREHQLPYILHLACYIYTSMCLSIYTSLFFFHFSSNSPPLQLRCR